MNPEQIPNEDLHRYVDGELTEARHAEIAAALAGHPGQARRVDAYRDQKQALRHAFDPVLDEPLPEALKALAKAPAPARRERLAPWSLQRIAASVVIAALGGLIGWTAHEQLRPAAQSASLASLPRQAAIAHAVFTPDVKRPVEISAEHEDQLVTWLSKRLGSAVRPPRLAPLGYELIGGRLLPGDSGPVAQFMYNDASGQRLTLYVSSEKSNNRDTAFRFAQEGAVNVFYWIDGPFGYAISGGLPKDELGKVSAAVYDQLQAR